jgi:hypothetical protein
MLAYCNNDPPTSGWNVYDLGSTYAVDVGEQFGVAAAYDSVNDRLMIAWVGSGSPKFAQVTFTRDANHNITGYTVGSVLTITPTYSPAHAPSLWMLHNGEVAAVWGADKTSGAKHSVVEFCRVVFGSPPTYKNAAGTANSKDTISSDYTGAFIIRYPSIVQRTNSGTGQYDLYAFFTDGLASYKVKAAWTGSAWTWGTQAYTAANIANAITSANYDVTNGLIVYTASYPATGIVSFPVGTIASDDTDTAISLTNLPSALRKSPSLVIVGGDYYIFYQMNNDIYYVKRSGGSWSSETQFTTTANENYPSCKIDGSANRIELIWTHYTGTAYNVYYDYLSLALGYNLNLKIMDYDLSDAISSAYVYKDSDVKVSDSNGWANWTLVSGIVSVKVKYFGFWVNGTFSVTMDSDKTIYVKCNLFDVTVNVRETIRSAKLASVNVTVFNGTSSSSNKIKSGISDNNGQVVLTNLPNNTLTFTLYGGSSYSLVIGNTTQLVNSDGYSFTVNANQNYVNVSAYNSLVVYVVGSCIFVNPLNESLKSRLSKRIKKKLGG